MKKIDKILLAELGLGNLPEDAQEDLINSLRQTLLIRVGMRLEESMADDRLEAFEKVIDSGDEKAATWLEAKIPQLDTIAEEELKSILAEIMPAQE